MENAYITDEELQLYYQYLMKYHGVVNVQDFPNLELDEEESPYSAEELALEVA